MIWTVEPCRMCAGYGRVGIGGRLRCPRCGGAGNDRYLRQAGYWWIDFIFAGKGPRTGWVVRVAGEVRAPVETVPMVWSAALGMHVGRSRERYQDVVVASGVAKGVFYELMAVVSERFMRAAAKEAVQ